MEDLGKIPDTVIALRLRVSNKSVWRHRQKLGIAPFEQRRVARLVRRRWGIELTEPVKQAGLLYLGLGGGTSSRLRAELEESIELGIKIDELVASQEVEAT